MTGGKRLLAICLQACLALGREYLLTGCRFGAPQRPRLYHPLTSIPHGDDRKTAALGTSRVQLRTPNCFLSSWNRTSKAR